jgi:carbon storage regulator
MSLVLARRVGESLMIGPDIIVRIVEIHGQQAKLSITAPRDVLILREELVPLARNAGEGEIT